MTRSLMTPVRLRLVPSKGEKVREERSKKQELDRIELAAWLRWRFGF